VAVRLLLALILTVALTAAGLVSTSQARKMQWFTCGGVTVRTAPWTMAIQDSIGVRLKHGTKYFLRAGSRGPSCADAKRMLAHVARLRTRAAIRAASFAGFHCDVGRLDQHVLWVRPRGAWAGCWSSPNHFEGRYFVWELNST
jgi:hypothetical protein